MIKGKTVGIDATTLEANAAMRSIVRRDTGESYQEFLTRLAQASGIETPTRAELARLDRKRKKKGSNDGVDASARSRRADHEDEGRPHASRRTKPSMPSIWRPARSSASRCRAPIEGDTTTVRRDRHERRGAVEAVATVTDDHSAVIEEVVADKGYHSNQVLVDLAALDLRT